jgi:hypothetical protein
MNFKETIIQEAENKEFDQEKYVKLATKWLEVKFPKDYHGFEFKHNPNLGGELKSYHVSVDGNEFEIAGKKFDTSGDGDPDTVVFRINPIEEFEDEEPAF